MSGFTKGPWWFGGLDNNEQPQVHAFGTVLISTVAHECVKQEGELMANAHLIAAAPDMYEALKDVLDDLDIGAHPHLHKDAIKAALAKAEGKS